MTAYWDLKTTVLKKIRQQGGWVNCHTHLDRAHTITPTQLPLAEAPLQRKWQLVDEIKRRSTVGQIYSRMAVTLEEQLVQGVTVLGSFIDVDEVIEDKAMQAAERLRSRYQGQVKLLFINQTLKGVLNKTAREWFDRGAEFVDIIGGLPGKDKGREAEHLDVLMQTAQSQGKRLHVHVDQLNTATETETELLAQKTIEYGLQGQVVGIHGISIASHPRAYRRNLYRLMKQAQLMMVACPTAWIDHRRSEELQPFHNAVTPAEELLAAGIPVGLGTDNIADIYKPFNSGELWIELRVLLESLHLYDIDQLVKISTNYGRKILGVGKE